MSQCLACKHYPLVQGHAVLFNYGEELLFLPSFPQDQLCIQCTVGYYISFTSLLSLKGLLVVSAEGKIHVNNDVLYARSVQAMSCYGKLAESLHILYGTTIEQPAQLMTA